jgi:carbonic anhydrase
MTPNKREKEIGMTHQHQQVEETWEIEFDNTFTPEYWAEIASEFAFGDVGAQKVKSYIRTLLKTTKEAGRLAAFEETLRYIKNQRLNPATAIMNKGREAENHARNVILSWLTSKIKDTN